MRILIFALLFVLLVSVISAECNETQIDINSASAEKLDILTGIGPAYAWRIIEGRPFVSVDDLINVSGIGEITLAKIKQQGLACVEDEIIIQEENPLNEQENNSSEETENAGIGDIGNSIEETAELIYENFSQEQETEKVELNPIILNSKNIKSEENNENLKKNLAFGGIAAFCIVFGALFLLKTRKRKNEFQ